jgi:hypothetical protein
MDLVPTPEAREALLARIKGILLQPKAEWPKIEAEPATVGSIYSNYVIYLAAVPVLCALIGGLVFGYGVAGITYRPSFAAALTTAVLQYALQLAGVYVFALIIDALAPRFLGRKDQVSAFKLAAYSATASWLAGIFTLIPALSILSIVGLYSLYLLYTGVPILMKVPAEKALAYTATIVVIGIVIAIVLSALGAMFLGGPSTVPSGEIGGKITLPGGVTVDMDKLDEAAKRMEGMAKRLEQPQGTAPEDNEPPPEGEEAASLPAIAPDDLKTLLPQSLPGGFARSDVSTATGGAAGFSFGTAKANYAKGDQRITLSLMDMGALGAFAALGGAFGANASEETETAYTKIGNVDGRMTVEEFNRETKTGKYGVVVGDRIMVEAAGSGAGMDALKAAVGAVDLSRVEALAAR